MHYKEQKIIEIALEHNGHFFSKMADEYGIERRFIKQLIDKNKLNKINSGAYCLPKTTIDHYYLLSYFHKHTVFDLYSSLQLHDSTLSFENKKIIAAMPHGTNLKRLDKDVYLINTRQPLYYNQGIIELLSPSKHLIKTYNYEMTLVHLMINKKEQYDELLPSLILQYIKNYGIDPILEQAILLRKKNRVLTYLKQHHLLSL